MKEVVLHIYDVTNSGSAKTNNTILQINRIFKDRIGLGGIFHSAVQVDSLLSFCSMIVLRLIFPLVLVCFIYAAGFPSFIASLSIPCPNYVGFLFWLSFFD